MCSSSNGGFCLNGAVSLKRPDELCLVIGSYRVIVKSAGWARCQWERLVTFIDNAFNHNVAGYPDEAYCIDVSHEYISIKAFE